MHKLHTLTHKVAPQSSDDQSRYTLRRSEAHNAVYTRSITPLGGLGKPRKICTSQSWNTSKGLHKKDRLNRDLCTLPLVAGTPLKSWRKQSQALQ